MIAAHLRCSGLVLLLPVKHLTERFTLVLGNLSDTTVQLSQRRPDISIGIDRFVLNPLKATGPTASVDSGRGPRGCESSGSTTAVQAAQLAEVAGNISTYPANSEECSRSPHRATSGTPYTEHLRGTTEQDEQEARKHCHILSPIDEPRYRATRTVQAARRPRPGRR